MARSKKYYPYRPRGAARELFYRHDPEILLSGPAGTGKSRGLLEKMNALAEKYDGSRQLLVRKTRASLTNTGIITFQQLVLPPGNAEVTYQQAAYPNGSVIDFGGMDKASKIMSSEYDVIGVLEATELEENDWESLSTRLRWGKIPYQQLIGDCNPAGPSHWLKKRADRRGVAMLESRHEDNPILFDEAGVITDKGAAYIAKLDALTGVRFKRLRQGIWAASEGMIYDSWDPALHLIERYEIPAQWPRVWVVDFGFTNPFVWQAWAIDPDGRLVRYREIYKTQRIVSDHAVEILKATRGEPLPLAIVCDHDAEDRATLERSLGMRTCPAFKDVSPGIQAVQARMRKARDGKPRLYLMRDSLVERDADLDEAKRPCCTEEEIEGYVWARGAHNDRAKDEPVKRDDHGMDAKRYAVALVDDVAIDPSHMQHTVTYVDERRQISRY